MAEPKKPANAPQESGEAPKKEAPGIVAANGRAQERLIQANKADKPTPKKKEEPAKKEKPTPKKTEKQPTKGTEEKPEPAKPEKKEKNWHLVRGTLSAENNDGSMGSTTMGIGIENKKGTAQILLGPTTTAQRAPSGKTDEQFHPIGLTGVINF